ncbi:hypothetical protein NGB36_19845 [Streptomyces sp. RB6PN25]|uniref:Thioesterase domain-containing protein n=1 Tax=Streptomyces humicola TaxID=2953240 RepID=A0ABT1PYP5_9ACTN|nr:hypothetical protein [Streptomyces humicola]MCQ4082796.1 hypothetical protein [Streptomyces humicola]
MSGTTFLFPPLHAQDPDALGDFSFRAVKNYRHSPGPKLSCPVVAMAGDAAPRVPVGESRRWALETTGPFELVVHPGGHFYLASRQQAVSAQVSACLRRFGLLAGPVM